MAGLSRYEKIVLLGTAGFVLFAGGWFLSRSRPAQPYEVTVARQEEVPPAEPDISGAEEAYPPSLLEGEVIDINAADLYDLQRLPGIGEVRARAILDYREAHGPFSSVDELDNVEGIGEGILSGLRDYACVGAADNES